MKRFLSISAIILALIAIVACLSACEFVSTPDEADHDHVFSDWETVKDPGCTVEGKKVKKCSLCDYEEEAAIPATGEHVYATEGKISRLATCVQNGIKNFYCMGKDCSEYYSEEYSLNKIAPQTIYDQTVDSVGVIETFDKKGHTLNTGMGFVQTVGGKIVTTYGVIKGAYTITIEFSGTIYGVESIIAYDEERDLAILQLSADTNFYAAKMCTETMPNGSEVYVVGAANGMSDVFYNGKMLESAAKIGEIGFIKHDAEVSPDLSGTPLVNAYGEIVAINSWDISNEHGSGYAVRIVELNNLKNNTKMSVPEFYAKTNDSKEALVQWVLGNYNDCLDSEFRYDFEDGTVKYSLVYDELSGKLSLDVFSTLEDGSELYCSVELGGDPTKYAYTASRTDGANSNLTKGTIDATKFTSSTALGASSFEGNHWSKNELLGIYQGAIVDTVRWFESVLDGSNLSTDIKDLGFVIFK